MMINLNELKKIEIDAVSKSREKDCFYFVVANNVVIYIGQTKSLRHRFANHHYKKDFVDLGSEFVLTLNFSDTLETEASLISAFKPFLNKIYGKYSMLSRMLRVSRSTITRILTGSRNASPNLALKLVMAIPGTSLEDWVFAKHHHSRLTKLVDRL